MRKYYANINLYFDEHKYSIVGDDSTNRQEMIELIQKFAKIRELNCNVKTKSFFDKKGKKVGIFTLASKEI